MLFAPLEEATDKVSGWKEIDADGDLISLLAGSVSENFLKGCCDLLSKIRTILRRRSYGR